uniref:Aryl hydrocarbon receptor-like n=1 Tax=Mastacembelus armatus TaxID=205130 RepID=A0A7N9AWW0_9TELE
MSPSLGIMTFKIPLNSNPLAVKTNPSKRHRDRLNVELDLLAGLLPFSKEVRGQLDKLSVLRLSVGYLKVKSYFRGAQQTNARPAPLVSANGRNEQSASLDGVSFPEGELLLQALNGFVLVVTGDGTIFYSSSTLQNILGFHQCDVVHQSVYELVHMDDRETLKCQLHFDLNPSQADSAAEGEESDGSSSSSHIESTQDVPLENSSFLERNFCCRFRCLLDNTSGFLALNFSGRLKYLHLQGKAGADGKVAPPQLALFAIATPLHLPPVMEIRTKTVIFQTKHRMDFAPVGIDTRGKLLLGYTEIDLVTTGSGYQFIHAADMMHCADSHLRMIKTGDSGFTFFRLLTKTGQWQWVQASAKIVFKGGTPDFIISRQKALTNEEGEEHLRQRRQQLPFNLATGEGVLYDISLDIFSGHPGSVVPGTTESTTDSPLDPSSLLGSFLQQDHSVYTQPQMPSPQLPQCLDEVFQDSHALLSVPGEIQTPQKRPVTGDLTSDAMIDSLEQILGDIRGEGMEGVEVEEAELKDWENTLNRMNKEREEALRVFNHIQANDVFSYVEEALRRETSGHMQGSDQTGPRVSVMISGSSFSGQQMTDAESNRSGFADQTHLGNVHSDVGNSTAQFCNPHQGHTASLWPPSSSNQTTSGQSSVTPQSWLPSGAINNFQSGHLSGLVLMDPNVEYTLNHTGSQQTFMGPQFQDPSVWQQH